MRYLVESKDAGNDKGAYVSAVAHDDFIASAMDVITREYWNAFTDSELSAMNSRFNKIYYQVVAGLWALGDSTSWEIDGCTFSVSAIADTKH